MMKRILILIAVAVSAASCLPFEDYLFMDNNIGFVLDNGSILCDNGVTYVITDPTGAEGYRNNKRIYATFKAKELISQSPVSYKAVISSYRPVKYKETLVASQVKDWDALGTDDIAVNQAWFENGYLNMYNSIYIATTDSTHTVDLVYDDRVASSDTLYVALRHNCKGDIGKTVKSFYTSFPLGDYFPAGKTQAILCIKWKADDEEGETIGVIYKN